jgi:hypothetical protein
LWNSDGFAALLGPTWDEDGLRDTLHTLVLRVMSYDSGPTCDDILRAALPNFPELQTLVVDDVTHDERRPDLKLVRERCPAIERVIFDGIHLLGRAADSI